MTRRLLPPTVIALASLILAAACSDAAGGPPTTAAAIPPPPTTAVVIPPPPTTAVAAGTAPPVPVASTTTTTSPPTSTTIPVVPACPAWARPERRGAIDSSRLVEISGLAVSRAHPGVIWVHNDSGDAAQVYAIDPAGNLLGTHELTGVDAVDWEDIAFGPGPIAGTDYLYVGDIGNNLAARPAVTVHRFPEPADPADDGGLEVETLRLGFPGEPVNAEALFVDPTDGAVFVVTKSEDGHSAVYRASGAASEEALELVAEIELRADGQATAADITPDGGLLAIRTYFAVFLWPRATGLTMAEALAAPPCRGELALEPQGEALGFDPSGGYYTTSEGGGAALSFVAPGE